MTIEELNRLRYLAIEVVRVNEQIERLRAYVQRTSPGFDGMPHGTAYHDAFAEYVANVDQYLDLRIELAGKMQEEIISLSAEIMSLPKPQADTLWKYYAEGKGIRRIAREMHYDKRHVYRLLRQGEHNVTTMSLKS